MSLPTFTRLIDVRQAAASGTIYYSSLRLPPSVVGKFVMYSIEGSTFVHRCIPTNVTHLPGLRFAHSYVGKSVVIIITEVDEKTQCAAHMRALRSAKEA